MFSLLFDGERLTEFASPSDGEVATEPESPGARLFNI